jgi:dipeptidyl aminopeptidase/acylaminoacyl peptidase
MLFRSKTSEESMPKLLKLALILSLALTAIAQTPTVTVADYQRAEKFLGSNTAPLVYHTVRASWLPDGRFWYRDTGADGSEFLAIDPAHPQTPAPLFDHARLAAALSAVAGGRTFDAKRLPFQTVELSDDGKTLSFNLGPRQFKCDLQAYTCTATGGRDNAPATPQPGQFGPRARNDVLSPDKKLTAFIRDWNLWVRDVASGRETQLTKDGVPDYGYATDNAGWTRSDRPILVWSADSKKIATFQQDQRKDGEMYVVETKVGHPTLQQWKYPLPGDKDVSMIERVIIELDGPKVVRFKMPPDQHRSTLCDHLICRGSEWADVEWSPDARRLAFVSTSRDHRQENFRVADAATGEVRDVLEEKAATYYESGTGRVNNRYLPNSNEVIWFSERGNWGQLYLYDLATGKLKHQITSGEGNVAQLLKVDEKNRVLYFLGAGKEKGRDPYYSALYRVGFDGRGLKLLTPEDANHDVSLSPTGIYFVDSYSSPTTPPVTVLRDLDGKLISTVAKADVSKLVAAGWVPPVPFTVKARDGQTDLYGLLYKPTNFDPSKKYPIVNHIYPGPQTGSVGGRSFAASRGDCQSLAELGFIVMELDGMGTPWRSKKFHDAYYGNLGDNTLPDQVTGMKQLAQKYPWIDLDRAGVYGHSGGGFAAAGAMFHFPDFFKVGISEAGNHDNREYEDDWAEKWMPLLDDASKKAYEDSANQNFARNLKGQLLLAHGSTDTNVPPYNTLLVVNELIKANKDFDLLLLPNRGHGFGNEPYMVRRRWDYFVRYLLGAEPPHEYQIKQPAGFGQAFAPPS